MAYEYKLNSTEPRQVRGFLMSARPKLSKGEKLKEKMKFIKSVPVVILAILILTVAGCSGAKVQKAALEKKESKSKSFPVSLKDDLGRKVEISKKPGRIVSLAPSNTEILFALGLGKKIVGVTSYCDFPEPAKKIEKIGDFATPNIEKIVSLKADIIFATGGIQQPVIEKIEEAGIDVFVADPKTVSSLLDVIKRMGKASGNNDEAEYLVSNLKKRIDKVKSLAAETAERPAVFYELYNEPLMTVGSGSLINDAITIAGGKSISASLKDEYPQFSLEKLISEDPEVYVGSTGSMQSPGDIAKRPGWKDLSAAKNGRVYVLDENIITRPGPRLVKAIEELAKAFTEK